MARPATGQAFVDAAQNQIAAAESVDALRAAQALLLPLMFGLSLEQTATAIGLSKSRTGKLRTQFQRIEMGIEQPRSKAGLRNHARMTLEEEAAFLAPFIDKAKNAGIIIVPPLKVELERHLGRSVAPSTVYRLLRRHGWRKLAPGKTPQSGYPGSGGVEKKLPKEIKAAQSSFKDVAPFRLMFQGEARFGRISDTRHCWCPKPVRPMAKAMVIPVCIKYEYKAARMRRRRQYK